MNRRGIGLFGPYLTVVLLACGFGAAQEDSAVQLITTNEYKSFSRIAKSPLMRMKKAAAWKKAVPEAKTVSIKSSADGTLQPALFYDSGSNRKKPLLLALHSWSSDYQKQFSIPNGIWAVQNDWVLIHPNYRGAYTNPQSTASELAIRDILDALDYAKRTAHIDTSRIYITGFSGGAMTALIMVGRFPEIWAACAAWVPVYDLAMWYKTTKHAKHNYSRHIANSCGGPPHKGTMAEEECRKRSVSAYLTNAQGRKVQVYVATGIRDIFVPPSHSMMVFNDLANDQDRILDDEMAYMDKYLRMPQSLTEGVLHDSLYSDAGFKLLYEKKSANVTLNIFNGRHDVIHNAGLYWLSRQHR